MAPGRRIQPVWIGIAEISAKLQLPAEREATTSNVVALATAQIVQEQARRRSADDAAARAREVQQRTDANREAKRPV